VRFEWFFIVETKKVAIEGIDTLFGGVNHAERRQSPKDEDAAVTDLVEDLPNKREQHGAKQTATA
jgi:hypothetical protein